MARSQAREEAQEQSQEIATRNTLPAYMNQEGRRGSEDVGIDDITLPRIEVLQALSPQIKRNDPKYIPGAEQGMIFNTVSGELYGSEITFVPIVFRKEWIIWQNRDSGGGFVSTHPTEQDAATAYDNLE